MVLRLGLLEFDEAPLSGTSYVTRSVGGNCVLAPLGPLCGCVIENVLACRAVGSDCCHDLGEAPPVGGGVFLEVGEERGGRCWGVWFLDRETA